MTTRTSTTRKASSSAAKKSTKTTRSSQKSSAATPVKKASKSRRRTLKVAPKVDLTTSDSAPAAKPIDPKVVREVTPVVVGAKLRKNELIEAVTERSGVKRRDAKVALEAVLEILGEAIAEGRQIDLPGLGKLKVTRTKKLSNGDMFTTRIRQPIATPKTDGDESDEAVAQSEPAQAKDPLAEAAE